MQAYDRMIPTEDRHEGVRAFNEKRKPRVQGALAMSTKWGTVQETVIDR